MIRWVDNRLGLCKAGALLLTRRSEGRYAEQRVGQGLVYNESGLSNSYR